MGRMGLALVAGPANAGKIAPSARGLPGGDRRTSRCSSCRTRRTSSASSAICSRRAGALLGGSIGTFDDLFREIAPARRRRAARGRRRPAGAASFAACVARTSLNGLGRSARFGGFADALRRRSPSSSRGCSSPTQLDGDLARLYAAYRAELDAARRCGTATCCGGGRSSGCATELDAWNGRPVFAYGFEDLTGAEWAPARGALRARTSVTVSLPYEPGRPAFASLQRTAEDLAALARGRIEELPAALGRRRAPRPSRTSSGTLFDDDAAGRRPSSKARSASSRARARAARSSSSPRRCSTLAARRHAARGDRARRARRSSAGARRSRRRSARSASRSRSRAACGSAQTPYGQALLALLRFAWRGGGRARPLRLPALAVLRASRARTSTSSRGGCAAARSPPARAVEEETVRLRDGQPLPALEAVRGRGGAGRSRSRRCAATMLRAAHGLEAPPARRGDAARPARARRRAAAARRARRLARRRRRRSPPTTCRGARAHGGAAGARGRARPGRRARPRARADASLRGRLRARARGGQPAAPRRRLAVPRRRRRSELDGRDRARLTRPDPVAPRPLPLLHRLHARDAAARTSSARRPRDEGSPREPSPFWDEVAALFAGRGGRALDAPAPALAR